METRKVVDQLNNPMEGDLLYALKAPMVTLKDFDDGNVPQPSHVYINGRWHEWHREAE